MESLRMTDEQIKVFRSEYLYKEVSYTDINIYPTKGYIVIEYTGTSKRNIPKTMIDTFDVVNYPTLYGYVSATFKSFVSYLKELGYNVSIDTKVLIDAKNSSEYIKDTRKIASYIKNELINICHSISSRYKVDLKLDFDNDKIKFEYDGYDYSHGYEFPDCGVNSYKEDCKPFFLKLEEELIDIIKIAKE